MMKKSLSLALVLILLAPVTGFACGCCGHDPNEINGDSDLFNQTNTGKRSLSPISQNSGPCCSTLELQRDPVHLQSTTFPKENGNSGRLDLPQAKEAAFRNDSPKPETGPPLWASGGYLFFGLPLYLSIQLLRI